MRTRKPESVRASVEIDFDVCGEFETGRDFGSGPRGFSVRTHLSNIQCHAQEDRKQCRRNGRCVIARTKDWKLVSGKSWKEQV